ncbi:hypothetical protein A4A49_59920 [Nicotiana attenuata]|uniref:Uncharacterized protein n=1 Tax=Nicotiana attenuata TaxID=49451 RepID=A0A1J6I859_NICAT|nr:hypothetical protein A4A49_59920 [Nicotiana attenuata]
MLYTLAKRFILSQQFPYTSSFDKDKGITIIRIENWIENLKTHRSLNYRDLNDRQGKQGNSMQGGIHSLGPNGCKAQTGGNSKRKAGETHTTRKSQEMMETRQKNPLSRSLTISRLQCKHQKDQEIVCNILDHQPLKFNIQTLITVTVWSTHPPNKQKQVGMINKRTQ